jgi:acetyl-CoA acetyltransferase
MQGFRTTTIKGKVAVVTGGASGLGAATAQAASRRSMAIDHFGITAPGERWRAIEDGTIARGGRLPINPSGGLIGLGHPVGATGVRMVLDAVCQVTGRAGDCQVEGANRFATLNIGGSATTVVSFVVEANLGNRAGVAVEVAPPKVQNYSGTLVAMAMNRIGMRCMAA